MKEFEQWELTDIKHLVKWFQKEHKVLALESSEDLIQECLMHWFFNRGQHCKTKAGKRTFLNRVVKHKLLDLVRRRTVVIRKAFFESVPLNNEEDNESMEAFLMIDDENFEQGSQQELSTMLSTTL